jgi:hypothetical protein
MFVLLHLFLEAAVWMDTQPFESMTTRDPAKLRLIGVVSWYQFQSAFLIFNFTPLSSRGLGHLVFIQKIAGSNPASGTKYNK